MDLIALLNPPHPVRKKLNQTLRIMRLISAIMLAACLQVSAMGYSQITLSETDVPLGKVLKKIEKQSGYDLLCTYELLEQAGHVTVNVKNATLREAVEACLKGKELSYEIHERTIVIKKMPAQELIPPADPAPPPPVVIHGRVLNHSGQPLSDVSVVIAGTHIGTKTNQDGSFTITAPGNKDIVLEISIVGYQPKSVAVGKQTEITVALEDANTQLNEVVMVGYGSQKRVNVLGSISTVKGSELTSTPMPNLAQELMGKASGVFIKNVNGQPGDKANVSINIRGFGTPLIIIDGVPATESDFEKLNPNDVESLSILKDAASASVYGARAGNGVVLVKTKRGFISVPAVAYQGNLELQHFTVIPHWVNSWQDASMQNLGAYNEGLPAIWTADQIQKFKDGSDPDKYPNTNWWDKTVRKYAPQEQHNLSVRGGSEKVKYYVSGGYFYQEAQPRANDTRNKQYSLRSNVDISPNRKLNINLDLSGTYQDFYGPFEEMERGTGQKHSIMTYLFRVNPTDPFMGPDPTKPLAAGDGNPYWASLASNSGYRKNKEIKADAKMGATYDLPFGIQAKINYHVYFDHMNNKIVNRLSPQYTYNWDTKVYTIAGYSEPGYSKVYNYSNDALNFDQNYFLSWDNKKFGDHTISAMVGYEQLSNRNDWFEASRQAYAFPIDYLVAGPALNQANNGDAAEAGRIGVISRINYSYKGKYLLELDSRYDASSLFPKKSRWGFFPSASVGWRISEENFMKNSTIFTNLKLRASWGHLGYDLNTNSFQFLQTYSVNGLYIYDGATNVLSNGLRADPLPNPSITWEKMSTKNIGADFTILNGLLEGSVDYFYRLRSDVLGTRIQSIPNVIGASLPQSNYAKYDNRGFELSLNHNGRFRKITYSIGGNVSWNREKTVYVDQNVFSNQDAYRQGNKIGQWTDLFWGYQTAGLFQSKDEIRKWADIDGKNNATVLPGDVKFIDYNHDGKITAADQVPIGRGDFPKLTYGVNMSVAWNGLQLAMLWQGAGMYDINLRNSPDLTIPFYADDNPQVSMLKNSYVPEGNPWLPANTTNAKWPIYRGQTSNRANPSYAYNSQLWLINGAYLRLKTVELGYTLPKTLTGKAGINSCRIYVSAYNLLTFSALNFIDPEIDTHAVTTFGDYYPPVGTYNFGIQLQF
jgi:TonB-linked SusC/RagA family outer membrane protein